MLLSYLLHENHLSKAIKRTIGIVEDIEHHVSLAAVETVRGKLLLLPYRTHLSLHILILRKISQLLELVDADDNPDALFLCQQLRQLENRHLITLLWHKLQVESHEVGHLVVDYNLRYHTCQEFLCILYPSFHFRGSTSYNLTGKSAIKFRFRADAEGINITDSYVIIFISQFAHRPFH